MRAAEEEVQILLVDDRPDQLQALEAILAGPGRTIVKARSGFEALRHLLKRDFAVILLDVNMPEMDGIDTAQLIRQRPRSEHTPIIFVTADDCEARMSRGYSLGAVDYILTPVVPKILKAKVGVFVEMHRKNLQVKREAESLGQRSSLMERLTRASLAINEAMASERVLETIADAAREIVGAHQAMVAAAKHEGGPLSSVLSLSGKYEENRRELQELHEALLPQPAGPRPPPRLARRELEDRHPRARALPDEAARRLLGGWLWAPLLGRDGRELGLIQVSQKLQGDFAEEDELALSQLAHIAAIAVENTLYLDAQEANRLKDEFLATISHELRTPLNAVLGWTHLMRTGKLDQETSSRALEVIERNVKTLARLVNDLLEVSRIISGKLRLNVRALDLLAVVRASLDAMRPAAEAKGIVIESQLDAGPVETSGDADRLQQVIGNLLSNAIKFTPAGGRIEINLSREGARARVEVKDSGIGIRPEFLPYVFDRFRQADSSSSRQHGGLGLGLAVARHLVELHRGKIQARSEGEGRGATFVVELPVLRWEVDPERNGNAGTETGPRGRAEPARQLEGLKVLLVEDEADSRQLLLEVLERFGVEVTPTGSAAEALDSLERGLPDVLISDLSMPEEDGYSLIRKLRARPEDKGGRIPAIALTAYAREEDRKQSLEAGFHKHLSKPVEPPDLLAALFELACQRA